MGDVLLLLDHVEGLGAVQSAHVELGDLRFGAAGLLFDHRSVDGEPGGVNLHPADVVAVDVVQLRSHVGDRRIAHRGGDDVGEVLLEPVPWVLVLLGTAGVVAVQPPASGGADLRDVCTVSLNLFRQLVIYVSPVLPQLAEQTGELLNRPIQNWDDVRTPLTGTPVSEFKHLMKRIEESQVQTMIEESKDDNAADAGQAPETSTGPEFHPADQWKDSGDALAAEPLAEECTIDDFAKVDLRVARVIEANHVEGANKLLQLTLSLGGGETRNVFAGIKAAYEPEKLVGRLVICVANLKPRQMKFGLSQGMVCASGAGGKEVFLLSPDDGSVPGHRVH